MQIKYRHVRTFLEVARTGAIGKAAAVLNVSQPAVTRTVRELEEALGATVIEPDGRGIRLTAAGEAFRRHAGASIAALRQGVDAVRAAEAEAETPVRVGALPTVSARVMPSAVRKYLAEMPGGRLKIVTGENAVLLDQLASGGLDLVVGRLASPERMVGFTFEHLYSEQVLFVVRAGHPLLAEAPFDIAGMADFPISSSRTAFPTPARASRASRIRSAALSCATATRCGRSRRASSSATSPPARSPRCRSTRRKRAAPSASRCAPTPSGRLRCRR